MLPPEKDDEPGKTDDGAAASPDAGAPEEPKAASGKRRRKSSESRVEEPQATATPEEAVAADETPTSSVEATPDAGQKDLHRDDAASDAEATTVVEASDPALRDRHPETGEGPAETPVAADDPKQSEPTAGADRAPPQASPPPAAPPHAAPPQGRSGGGFLSSLVAAIIGGLIGAGAVWYYLQQQEPAGPDPEFTAALEQQGGEVASLSERLAAIEGDIGSLNEALDASDVGDAIEQLRMDAEGRFESVTQALAAATERAEAVENRLAEADARIEELEARPIADPETANQVLRSEVANMRQEVEQATEAARRQVETMQNDLAAVAEQTQQQILEAERRAAELEAQAQERIRQAEAEAEATARAAEAEAALAQIEAAIDSGEPYPDVLETLRENAEEPVPDALASAADTGVPTIAELRADYPDAARDALRATAVATTEGDPADRFVAFLRTQTRARSLTPQEGDSPDAILSRAEAALADGDVAAALAELEALPEDGREAMQGWLDEARQRAEAVEAAETFLQNMN